MIRLDQVMNMRKDVQFKIGKVLTRKQIHKLFGGDEISYLPHVEGRIVCGCFDTNLNPYAPELVPFGDAPNVVKYAELLVRQKNAIPVFLKLASNQWEYRGYYRPVKISRERKYLDPSVCGRDDAVGVLLLEEVVSATNERIKLPDIDLGTIKGHEGLAKLVTHLKRERNPSLSKAKKRIVFEEMGRLICEACDFDFSTVPDIGDACCEVHHLK
ncbi:MAG: hypothetical protein ABR577_19420, partial [Pyrinomonadaceae bacterium]